jgi:hypothetical protein
VQEHDATRTQTVRLHFSQLDTLFGIELAKVASLRNETARRKYWGIHSFKKLRNWMQAQVALTPLITNAALLS